MIEDVFSHHPTLIDKLKRIMHDNSERLKALNFRRQPGWLIFLLLLVVATSVASPMRHYWAWDGDSLMMMTGCKIGWYPNGSGLQAWIIPWRAFHVTPYCSIWNQFGLDSKAFISMAVMGYTLTAFAWYLVVNRIFRNHLIAACAAVLFLTVPDAMKPGIIAGARQYGPALALFGSYLFLLSASMTIERRLWRWAVPLGMICAFLSFLIYETLIGFWALGIPLILIWKTFFKSSWVLGRNDALVYSLHTNLRLIACVYLVLLGYGGWRLYVPTTYTSDTLIAGAHSSSAKNISSRLGELPLAPVANVVTASNRLADYFRTTDGIDVTRARVNGAFVGLLIIGMLWLCSKPENSHYWSERVNFWLAFPLLPIMSSPFLVTNLRFTEESFRSMGLNYGLSLLIVGAIYLFRTHVRRLALIAVTMIIAVFASVYAPYEIGQWNDYGRPACKFWTRFTEQVSELPTPVYILIEDAPTIIKDKFNADNLAALLYLPVGTPYDLGKQGFAGISVLSVDSVTQTGDGFRGLSFFVTGATQSPFPQSVNLPNPISASQAIVAAATGEILWGKTTPGGNPAAQKTIAELCKGVNNETD